MNSSSTALGFAWFQVRDFVKPQINSVSAPKIPARINEEMFRKQV